MPAAINPIKQPPALPTMEQTTGGSGALAFAKYNPDTFTAQSLRDSAGPMQGATSWSPDENALASSQLTKMLAADSPLIQQARTRAAQMSGARGTLNSSMAIGAAEGAAWDAATPIAMNDAGTFARAQSENTSASNQFSRDANQFSREGALTIAQAGLREFGADRQRGWQSGENAADRSFRTSEREAGETFSSGENAADRAFRSGEGALDRTFRSGESAADRALRVGEGALDRTQQSRIAEMQNQGMDRRQAEQIAATERSAQVQNTFTAARDDKAFSNEQKLLVSRTDQDLRRIDAQNGTNLANDYREKTTGLYEAYSNKATEINGLDLDPDVKQGQLDELKSLFTSRQSHLNTVFSNQTAWNMDWAQFLLEFED